MASDGEALTELCLEDWWWAAKNRQKDNCTPDSELEVFRITRDWLQAYFADERPSLSQAPPMNPAATPFQHEVWQLVAEIPYGMTASQAQSDHHHRALPSRGRIRPCVWRLWRPARHQGRTARARGRGYDAIRSARYPAGINRHSTPTANDNRHSAQGSAPTTQQFPESCRETHTELFTISAPSAPIQSLQWKAHGSRQTAAVHELGAAGP